MYIQLIHYNINCTVDPPSPVLGVVQNSESFGLVNVYTFNGAYFIFYLIHHKILMNIIKCGVRICEGSD